MLRVRTAIAGFEGGPGLMTSYFETPLEDADAATRATGYVHGQIARICAFFMPDAISLSISGDVDVLTAATGAITNTLSVTAPAVINGSGGASKAPAAIAALCRLTTGVFVAGRRVRGRIFVSPLADSAVTSDGILGSAGATALTGLFANVSGDLDSGDSWVVWHRPQGGSGGEACEITATTGPFKLAVLRSRRD